MRDNGLSVLAWMPVPGAMDGSVCPLAADGVSNSGGHRDNTGMYCACPDDLRVLRDGAE